MPKPTSTQNDDAPSSDADAALDDRLSIGDLVVHLHHGIGRFDGLADDPRGGGENFTVTFADGAVQVPTADGDLLWRYGPASAGDDARLAKLGSDGWAARMASIDGALHEAADAFRARQAELAKRTAPALDWDAKALTEIAKGWHELTEDQAAALDAIRKDTTSDGKTGVRPPMDRLLCGDTGYGKTEVLLRAAVAAVAAGRQAAIAAPTHMLAQQHCQTFHERLEPLGIQVRCLTGTTDKDEAEDTLTRLREGEPMVLVGTHALASDDVEFGVPGLLVIDEEQRFGADIKATLREKMIDAHVLATTATPIPRTTAAAMIGLRAISTLRHPPKGREPIRTEAPAWEPSTLHRALMAEREAGGRSFVVVSRIADMDAVEKGLRDLDPSLDIRRLHGRVDDGEADEAMDAFRSGECDVLLATTVIETGIDVPDANLMVVLDATRLGVGQLHQLRGRVGRGERQGRALLFTECAWIDVEGDRDAEERADMLVRHTGIGAGFAIAADDLAQRGAGDLFGDEQRGHLSDVGLELFGHLLHDITVGEGRAARQLGTARVSSPDASLPVDYVEDETVRSRLYGRVAKATTLGALDALAEEMAERFGPLPDAAKRLVEDARLTLRLRADGVREITFGPRGVAATFSTERADALRDRITIDNATWKGDKIVLAEEDAGPADLLSEIEAVR